MEKITAQKNVNTTKDKEGQENNGVYVNGRGQVVEILKALSEKERETLLENIRKRNPTLARELFEESISFASIVQLDANKLEVLSQFVSAQIMGVAFKPLKKEEKRIVLSKLPRAYAEECYSFMTADLSIEPAKAVKAQTKVLSILNKLYKEGAFHSH